MIAKRNPFGKSLEFLKNRSSKEVIEIFNSRKVKSAKMCLTGDFINKSRGQNLYKRRITFNTKSFGKLYLNFGREYFII